MPKSDIEAKKAYTEYLKEQHRNREKVINYKDFEKSFYSQLDKAMEKAVSKAFKNFLK